MKNIDASLMCKNEVKDAVVRHLEKWNTCTACKIGAWAYKHVHIRGKVPAQVLFVGEAPGVSEDMVGAPFIGRAGDLLDAMMKEAGINKHTYAVANALACRPTDVRGGSNRVPSLYELRHCGPRLQELARLVNPKGVVLLGRTAIQWAHGVAEGREKLELYHPAYILRLGGSSCPAYAEFVKQLKKFLKGLK